MRAESLTYGFIETEPLVEGLSFEVLSGQIAAIVGPSGSGKSTLLSVLGGVMVPSSGQLTKSLIGGTQWVFQNPHGPSERTALDIAGMPLLSRGSSRIVAEREATEVLGMVGLQHRRDARFRQLSGGEAQRLMFARAIAARPGLLLLDEPTGQLDTRSTATVIRSLRAVADSSRVVFVATHDTRVVDACDMVIRIGDAA